LAVKSNFEGAGKKKTIDTGVIQLHFSDFRRNFNQEKL